MMQEACVSAVLSMVSKYAADRGVLLLFGAYSVGKERVFMQGRSIAFPRGDGQNCNLQVARKLNEKVYVDKTRYKTLSCLE
jgi:hypothetical protein